MFAVGLQKVSFLSLLTSDVQGFLLSVGRMMLKVLGRVWYCCMKNFFSGFEGVCVLEVCSFNAVLNFALW